MSADSVRRRVPKWAACGLLALLFLLTGLLAPGQADSGEKCKKIHDALIKAKIPVLTVRYHPDRSHYQVVYGSACTKEQLEEGERLKSAILAEKPDPPTTGLKTVEDALVVIQFEPDNAEAKALLRKRYAALKARGRTPGKARNKGGSGN